MLSVSSDKYSEIELQDMARYQLRNAIQAVNGAVAPAVFGGKSRAVLAYVDRNKLEARDLSPVDVVTALRNYNTYRGASGGAAWTHYKEWLDTSKPPFTNS